MSLDHAILGFLKYNPMSGYDLKKIFDLSIQHFWHADQSQIYRTLNRLADRQWVEVEIVKQDDRPDRKLYRITEAGEQELAEWLALPMPKNRPHIPGLVQVFFSAELTDEEIVQKLERRLEELTGWKALLLSMPDVMADYANAVNSAREVYCWQLTLLAGVHDLDAQLQWLKAALDHIKKGGMPKENDVYLPEILKDWPIAEVGIEV